MKGCGSDGNVSEQRRTPCCTLSSSDWSGLDWTGRSALTTRQLICDRSHAEHSAPAVWPGPARPDGQTDGRTDPRAGSRQLTRHGNRTAATGFGVTQRQQQRRRRRRLWHGDGADRRHITRAGAAAAAAAGSRPSSNYTPPTDRRAAIPPHSVVADRHDDDDGGGSGRSGRLDEIGSIVRRSDRTSATTATDRRPLASESSDQCCTAALQARLTGRPACAPSDKRTPPLCLPPAVRPPTGRMDAARTQRQLAAVDSSISGRGRAFDEDYDNNDNICDASVSRRRRATVRLHQTNGKYAASAIAVLS